MPTAKELTVTTGWGRGKKARFGGFAEGNGGLLAQHVGPTTTPGPAAWQPQRRSSVRPPSEFSVT